MLKKIVDYFVKLLGKIHWSTDDLLTPDDLVGINQILAKDYYIILTRRKNHLSTYFISFANFVLSGKFSYWSHALMNLEDQVNNIDDYRLIEAVGKGVTYSDFMSVFNVSSVALLKPKGVSLDEWTSMMDAAKENLGKPYDSLFDLKSDKAMSCVELVRDALMSLPNYETRFARFESLIKKRKNLTPQMFYECEDFETVLEIKH